MRDSLSLTALHVHRHTETTKDLHSFGPSPSSLSLWFVAMPYFWVCPVCAYPAVSSGMP